MWYETFFADSNLKIARVVDALNRAADRGEPAGLDTEFYGLDIRRQSTVATSKLHLLSVAVRRHPARVHPRGFGVADAAVFLRPALDHPALARWLEGPAPKVVHNLPVDAHTLCNEGVALGGGINSLALSRWAWPGRARAEGFTLDALARDLLGVGKTESFQELFRREEVIYRVRSRRIPFCECGVAPRRGHPRSSTPGHARLDRVEETRIPKTIMVPVPLEEVVPGHVLWPRALAYSAQDAVLALAVHELALRDMTKTKRVLPW